MSWKNATEHTAVYKQTHICIQTHTHR